LEQLKVPFELRVIATMLYDNVIDKFTNTEGYLEKNNYNIGVKQCCPLSPTLFNIYIDKLEDFLEDADCVGPTLTSIVFILFLYVDDVFLMEKSPYDLGKKLITLEELCSSMGMTMNTDKTKVMIIKSKRITYDNIFYENNSLEEVPSYKSLGIDIHHKLNWNYSIDKG
jgi:hypothetical protein